MSASVLEFDRPVRASDALTWTCRLLIVVSIALCFVRLMQAEPLQSANDRSRWATVRALVEQGTYRIDDVRRLPGWDTIDLVKHEGHFYSTKPPLLPTLVAGLYVLIRETLGWSFADHLAGTTRLILVILNLLPFAIAQVLLLRMVRRIAPHPYAVLVTAAAACFGTLLLPFVGTFNNHTPAAVSVVFSLYPLAQILVEGRRSPWLFAMTGFWAAFAFTNELPAAAYVAAVAGLLALVSLRQMLLWFVPAALVPLVAFFASNFVVTGGLWPFYAAYGTEKYEFVHEGVPSYWMHPRGIDKSTDSTATYFVHCTIGHHGLLSLTPIYVLTLIGWGRSLREFAGQWKLCGLQALTRSGCAALHAVGAALTAIVLAFFLTRTENYNYGGVSVALRWMLWLVPFWLLVIPAAFDDRTPSRRFRSFIGCMVAVSVFSAWYPFDGPWKQPWLFTVLEHAGWIDYSDPRPQYARPVRSWVFALPNGARRDPDYWLELSGRAVDGSPLRLRIADGGTEAVDGVSVRIVEVTLVSREGEQTERYAVDPVAFATGADPAQFLKWTSPPTDDELAAAIQFWHGLPQPATYRAAVERYLRLPLRRDAFHCLQGYAQVTIRDTSGQRTWHRRDVWSCDELPFGLAQIETQVQDSRRQVIARQRLTATAAGKTLSAP